MSHIPDIIKKRYGIRVVSNTCGYSGNPVSYEEIDVKGMRIRPIDLTAKLLFPKWKLKPGEEEFTVMRIRMTGEENGQAKKIEYNLLNHTKKSGTLSMARTTGYTCTSSS